MSCLINLFKSKEYVFFDPTPIDDNLNNISLPNGGLSKKQLNFIQRFLRKVFGCYSQTHLNTVVKHVYTPQTNFFTSPQITLASLIITKKNIQTGQNGYFHNILKTKPNNDSLFTSAKAKFTAHPNRVVQIEINTADEVAVFTLTPDSNQIWIEIDPRTTPVMDTHIKNICQQLQRDALDQGLCNPGIVGTLINIPFDTLLDRSTPHPCPHLNLNHVAAYLFSRIN